ncbi:sodium:proton antiporter NhaD [Neptunomonas sp.]|uniref:sodium:proton antiporter NhaD n=1 Tax=Neptunomonas sp. TaxID=1971898 RepID=UPI003562D8A1
MKRILSQHTTISILVLLLMLTLFVLVVNTPAWAFTIDKAPQDIDLTNTFFGYLSLLIFVIGYLFVLTEEFTRLRKSKPIIVAAGLIWLVVGIGYALHGDTETAGIAVRHNILEYAELFLFLLAAMTFINMMEERNVFAALRSWLVRKDFSILQIYWITGTLAFFISPLADNLSTALLMGAVVLAVGNNYLKFVTVGCINIVVAANAGGAFSPFGDITTLMVWQKGMVQFEEFFLLFLPALVNWLVPALIMSRVVEKAPPARHQEHQKQMKRGGVTIILLFLMTIATSVMAHSILNLPPVLGMMTGLGVLKLYGYYLSQHEAAIIDHGHIHHHHKDNIQDMRDIRGDHTDVVRRFDIFKVVERASWDTLMFFYGVVLCVGGLSTLGYLALLSDTLYGSLGTTWTNSLIGVISAVIDNIPVMFAVLTMNPVMNTNEWLLVTLTAGVGGSLLSIGSAAGIALMGQAQGTYTFMSHLKWSWAIALGYVLSILTHLWINGT